MARRQKKQCAVSENTLYVTIDAVDDKHLRAILKLTTEACRMARELDMPYHWVTTFDKLPGPVRMEWRNCKPRDKRLIEKHILRILARKLARRTVVFEW